MLGDEDAVFIFSRELSAGIKRHTQIGTVSGGFYNRMNNSFRDFLFVVAEITDSNCTTTKPRVAKVLTGCGLPVQFTGWYVVTHAVDLVISPPQLTGFRVKVLTD